MNTYKRILALVTPFWKHLGLAIISTFLYSLLHGASVYLSIPLLDTLFQQSESELSVPAISNKGGDLVPSFITNMVDSISTTFHQFIFTGDTTEILFRICILILLTFFGKSVFGYLQDYYLSFVQQGIIKSLRDRAYIHLHKLPMSYFKNERTGDLISRITNDVNVVQNSFSIVFLSLFREPVTIIVFMAIAISISWKLFLVSLVDFTCIYIINWLDWN